MKHCFAVGLALLALGACMDAGPEVAAPTEGEEVFYVTVGGVERRIRSTPFGDGQNSYFYVTAPDRDSAIAAYHEACWNSGVLDLAAWDTDMVPYNAATGEHSFIGHCPDRR